MDSLNIFTISDVIPKKLLTLFEVENITTIQDILDIDISTFPDKVNIDADSVNDLIDLKKRIFDNYLSLSEKENGIKMSFNNLSQEYLDIQIKEIKNIIPTSLFNKLKSNNLISIDKILSISDVELLKMKSVGQKSVQDFKELQKKLIFLPEEVESNKIIENIIPKIVYNDFFKNFESLVIDYFILLNNEKAKNIFYKRYGILGYSCYTLDDIGTFYQNTRERIRQIQHKQFINLLSLMKGESLKKPSCKSHPSITNFYNIISSKLLDKDFVTEIDILNILDIDFQIKVKDKNLLILFFELLKFSNQTYDGISYFFVKKGFNYNEFNKTCDSLVNYLKHYVKPITEFDLVVNLNKKKTRNKIDSLTVSKIINMLPYIEIITLSGEEKFQLSFEKLQSLKDMSYRILLEQNKRMHFKEILRDIKHRLTLKKCECKESLNSLSNQLVADTRFQAVGGMGFWVLTEWNENTDSIVDLIVQAFYHINKACNVKVLHSYIVKKRPEINIGSIASIISQHKNKFSWVESGVYILKEWENSNAKVKTKEKQITHDELSRDLFEILSGKALPISEIKIELENYGIFWSSDYCYTRLYSCDFLKIEKFNNKNFYSLSNTRSKNTNLKYSKLDRLKKIIIEYLDNQNLEKILLKRIVKNLKEKGAKSPSIYSVISKNPNIFIKQKINGVIFISLSGKNVLSENSEIINHNENILKGESNLIEFKSSLRWDIKRDVINKDLEFMVVKAIASFLNSEGGALYIGVDDFGNVLGIEKDILTLHKKNIDGLNLHFNELLISFFDKSIISYVVYEIIKIEDVQIVYVKVSKSSKPVYVKKGNEKLFLVRFSASVQNLDIQASNEYISNKWK